VAVPVRPPGSTEPSLNPEIEAVVLAAYLQGHVGVVQSGVLEEVEGSLFGVPSYTWLVDKVLKPARGRPVPEPLLRHAIAQAFPNPEERERHEQVLVRLCTLDTSWATEALQEIKNYLAWQHATASVRETFQGYSRTRNVVLALHELQKGLSHAERILTAGTFHVEDYAAGYQAREARRRHVRDNPETKPCLRLGVAKFDAQVRMEQGTVTNFLAPMKRYKSVILASLAYCALLQGFNVVLVVVENTMELTQDRLDAMFSQIHYDRVVHALKTPEERVYADELFERINSWPQRLKIIKGDPYKISTVDVERQLDVMREREGFVAEVKIYDYLNVMRPSVDHHDEHKNQEQLIWDTQAVAKDKTRPSIVVTATQTNMAGAEVDKDGKPVRVQIQHQGKNIAFVQAADSTVAINLELCKVEGALAVPPRLILSPLLLRNGAILYPDVPLVSQIDQMCLDREQRRLWEEVDEAAPPMPPGDR
jgi:hypothetical protein